MTLFHILATLAQKSVLKSPCKPLSQNHIYMTKLRHHNVFLSQRGGHFVLENQHNLMDLTQIFDPSIHHNVLVQELRITSCYIFYHIFSLTKMSFQGPSGAHSIVSGHFLIQDDLFSVYCTFIWHCITSFTEFKKAWKCQNMAYNKKEHRTKAKLYKTARIKKMNYVSLKMRQMHKSMRIGGMRSFQSCWT